jgi:hypothetical protein
MAARNLPEFDLAEVPYYLQGYIYANEKGAGRVMCPRNHYLVVQALRFILSYTAIHEFEEGDSEDYDTWKVFWRVVKPGVTGIYLYRERTVLTNWSRGYQERIEVQTEVWHELAILGGSETLFDVLLNTGQPYNTNIPLSAVQGIKRLIENAAHASQATPSHPVACIDNPDRLVISVTRSADYWYDARDLRITLDIGENDSVRDINLRVVWDEPDDPYGDEEYYNRY